MPPKKKAKTAAPAAAAVGKPDYVPTSIMVTGAAGFIASHAAIELVKKYPAYKVIAYDKLDYCAAVENLDEVKDCANFEFVKGDICDSEAVISACKKHKIDTIMHFAAQSHVDNSFGNSVAFTHNNVVGTHVLLEVAKNMKMRRFIHVSTDEVYGETDMGKLDSVLNPTNPYAASKAAAEMLVMSYAHSYGVPIITTRGNNVYGPHQFPEKLIPKFLLMVQNGTPLTIHGTGASVRSFLFVKDVAAAFDSILHNGTVGEIYNISTPEEKSVKDVATEICKVAGVDYAQSVVHVEDRLFNDTRYFTDGSKLAALGWKPETSWEEGFRITKDWYYNPANIKRWPDAKDVLRAHPALKKKKVPIGAGVQLPTNTPPQPRTQELPVKDARIVVLRRFDDYRGSFAEAFNLTKDTAKNGKPVLQISMSRSIANVVRGIHCSTYGKIVTCIEGSLYDFVVDLRPNSPTYMQSARVLLTPENMKQLVIPANCGHAFIAGPLGCTIVYGQEGTYHPPNEMNVKWDCPTISFRYPLNDGDKPIVSKQDIEAPTIKDRRPECKIPDQRRRVLIIGGSGQVGSALEKTFGDDGYSVMSTYTGFQAAEGQFPFDLQAAAADSELADELITFTAPDVVIICGAFCWVDGCENQKDKAYAINAAGAGKVAAAATKIAKAKVVFYSTDYVFDGKSGMYTEDAAVNPLNEYGRSKLQGELLVMSAAPGALIIRTTGVFGPEARKKNFVNQLIKKSNAGEAMKCPTDQVSNPTYTHDLALATFRLVNASETGVFNVAGPETLDRLSFAEKVSGILGLDTSKLSGFTTDNIGQTATRPLNGGLNTDKLLAALPGFEMRSIKDALADWGPMA